MDGSDKGNPDGKLSGYESKQGDKFDPQVIKLFASQPIVLGITSGMWRRLRGKMKSNMKKGKFRTIASGI